MNYEDFYDLPNFKQYNGYLSAVCPWHQSTPVRRSLFVWPDWFKCKSCGKQGSNFNYLYAALIGQPYYPLEENFKNLWSEWLIKYNGLLGTIQKGYQRLQKYPPQYLRSRGLTRDTVTKLRLGLLDDCILIPFYEWGGLSGAAARTHSTPKYIVPAGQNPHLLYIPDEERVRQADKVFVTYGLFDAIVLHQLGYAAMSTTSGQTSQAVIFQEWRKPLTIIPDKGEESSALKLADRLGWRGNVLRLNYPAHTKDVNDFYLYDREMLQAELDKI